MANWGEEVELEELREKAQKTRSWRDLTLGYWPYTMPTMAGISHVFEGFQSMDDVIGFQPYDGDVVSHHRGKDAYVPRLQHPSTESGETVMDAMDTLLRKKIRETLHLHDPQQDGELNMCIKFGKVYCIDVSVGQTARVREIYRSWYHEKDPPVNISFNPTPTPTSDIEAALGKQFKLKTQNEYVRMKVKVQEPYHYWDIELDENFELRHLSPRDIRFANLTIVAADATQVDVRVNVNSSRKFSVSDVPADSVLRKYMRGDWVLRDDRHGLVINTANPLHSRLTYASTRKERVYELERPRSLHSPLEKRLQVRVQEATDYDEPHGGRFQKVTERCELFLHVTTREAIAQVVDSADFVQSLFSLAARMSPQ